MKTKAFINNLIKENGYMNRYNDSFYIYSYMEVLNGDLKITINAPIYGDIMDSMISFLKTDTSENIIMSVRSDKEPHSAELPTKAQKKYLVDSLKDKNIRFFNQEPWPEPVPNFNKNNLVVRFGYDEGCELDKITSYKLQNTSKLKNGKYYFLLNKKESIELTKKISII